jgi:hypothetical protein
VTAVNKAGELSELAVTNKAVNELNDLMVDDKAV